MRFMLIRRADAMTESEAPPDPQVFEDMLLYNEEMARAGVLRDGMGLHPSKRDAARVKITRGGATVTDGPFAEAKELIAGFTLIDVASFEEALAWVRKWPQSDGDAEIEIRRVWENDEFGDAFPKEMQDRENAILASLKKS